jgi:hypothetical protein
MRHLTDKSWIISIYNKMPEQIHIKYNVRRDKVRKNISKNYKNLKFVSRRSILHEVLI